jgi:putative addiction module component (TIGR02574 family)
MSATLSALTLEVLQLSAGERLCLVDCLLDSLDESAPMDASLLEELTRRADELRSGSVGGLTTEQTYGFSL